MARNTEVVEAMVENRDLNNDDIQDNLPFDRRRKREQEEVSTKSSNRKKKARRRITDEGIFDEELGVNTAIGQMDSQLLIDHVAQRTKKFEPRMSSVEMEDRYIPARAILDTTSWGRPRTTENLPAFLEHFGGKNLSTAPEAKGSPHTLVVVGAGLRAADLTRKLREFQTKDSLIAKLFAKHIKLKEAIEFCRKYRCVLLPEVEMILADSTIRINIGVGTPQRIHDLLDEGALSAKNLKTIIVDASYVDQKKRGILDMRETQLPLVKLLSRPEFKERYEAESERLQLLFY